MKPNTSRTIAPSLSTKQASRKAQRVDSTESLVYSLPAFCCESPMATQEIPQDFTFFSLFFGNLSQQAKASSRRIFFSFDLRDRLSYGVVRCNETPPTPLLLDFAIPHARFLSFQWPFWRSQAFLLRRLTKQPIQARPLHDTSLHAQPTKTTQNCSL